ncbi:MAG: ExbD/TolR family protein [Opitutales bacterium]
MSATPHSITEPLNLRGYLRAAPRGSWDFLAVLDLLLIVGLLFLHQSHFIFAPGTEVSLASVDAQVMRVGAGAAVLTVRREGLVFFDGQKIVTGQLPEILADFRAAHPDRTDLLLKADRSLSLQTLTDLFETAEKAGFARVQLAAEPRPESRADDFLP